MTVYGGGTDSQWWKRPDDWDIETTLRLVRWMNISVRPRSKNIWLFYYGCEAGEALDHVLLYGPWAWQNELANIIATEMGVVFIQLLVQL